MTCKTVTGRGKTQAERGQLHPAAWELGWSGCERGESQLTHTNSTAPQRARRQCCCCPWVSLHASPASQHSPVPVVLRGFQPSSSGWGHITDCPCSDASRAEQLLDSLASQPARLGDCQASPASACYSNKPPFVSEGLKARKKDGIWTWRLMAHVHNPNT